MTDASRIKVSKKQKITLIGVILLILATIITVRVVATSTIKVLWSYKNVDKNYIVCQVEDTEYGISRVTNLDGTVALNIDLEIDSQTGGQVIPLTIKYPLANNETAFKVWNTNDNYKIVKMNEISLNITNASVNEEGTVLAISAFNEDGNIESLQYNNGDIIKSYTDTQDIFESIKLNKGGTSKINIITNNSTYPIAVELDKDKTPPQQICVYKNPSGQIAVTAQSSSGIWQITDMDGNPLLQVTQFETYGTYIFEATGRKFLIKNGVGKTTEVMVPKETVNSEEVSINVSYEPNAFVINATNNSVGLWKITNSQDDTILYTFQEGPNTGTYSISRDLGVVGVKVYDMAGNFTTKMFDTTGPLISWVYKNTVDNMIIVCVEDTDSGLKYVKDVNGNKKWTFGNDEKKSVFEYYVEDGVNSLNIYDCENNLSTLEFSDIKFNVTKAYKNIDGDKISIVANIEDENDADNYIDRITYIDGRLIEEWGEPSIDKSYNLRYDGTVKINLYDRHGDYIVVVLDYEEDDEPEVTKFVKSENTGKVLIKAKDFESGLGKITYNNGGLIKKFVNYTQTIDDVYNIMGDTDSIMIWDRVGNYTEIDFTSNKIDEDGPELVDDIQYDENGDDYTLTLRDAKAGLYRITKYATDEVLYDFKNDGYPNNGTYRGKISTDGADVKIYDRLGNVTVAKVDVSGPKVISCTPRGDDTRDWEMVVMDGGIGASKIIYENGNLICDIPGGNTQQTVNFSVEKGTNSVLVADAADNYTRVVLDSEAPIIKDINGTSDFSVIEVIAQDTGTGLKSVRTRPNGEDIAFFEGNTRQEEQITVTIGETVDEIYVVDLAGNISEPFKLNRGFIIIGGGGTVPPRNGGGIVVGDDDDNDGIIDIKLFNDTGEDIIINKDDHGNRGPNPGIRIREGTTVRLLLGHENVYVYGGYVGSGARERDANYIHYPGITVPENSKLIIQNFYSDARGTLYTFGNAQTDYGIGDGSAAGIGGYGVVKAGRRELAYAQSTGEMEFVSGNVVSISEADINAYGTGAGIGGGGACAWRGTAVAGLGDKNNIIIHDEANVVASTNGSRGVGANIGGGGKYDSVDRKGSSGSASVVNEEDLPVVSVSHTPTEETHKSVTIKVVAKAEQGLYKVSLDDDYKEVIFDDFPTEETTCTFKVNENRRYRILVTDKYGLSTLVRYRIDNIIGIVEEDDYEDIPEDTTGDDIGDNNDNEETGVTPSLVRISESFDKGIRIYNDCTIIFDNDQDIIINKEYKTNLHGMAGIQIKNGANVRILQIGKGNVAIYGGHNEDTISYPGIMVPNNASLEIQGITNAKLYSFGYGMVSDDENMIIGGSGAGIGGYGYYNRGGDARAQDCGSVRIVSGNVECYGGTIELREGTSQASGAGIGGGGAYSVMGMAISGKIQGTIENYGGNVVAISGVSNRACGAGVGNGGAATVEGVNINGREVEIVKDYIEITTDTVVTKTTRKGYRITRDCTLTFANTGDISVGSTKAGCAGISVANGVYATINIAGSGNVSVYGGYTGRGNAEDGYYMMCPGIEVPKKSRLTINNKTAQSLSVYGGGLDEIPVTAAGIGTSGVYSSGMSAISNDVGRIIINGGALNVIPKKVAYYGDVGAVGAGIGSGGAASNNPSAVVKVGKLRDNTLEIADIANVEIKASKTTKIGNGNKISNKVVTKGEEKCHLTIDTLPPEVEIGRIDEGRYGYAQIKVGACDATSKLSKVELDDGTVYRFPRYRHNIGSVYFKYYKNGPLSAKVYDKAGNYRRVGMTISGLSPRNEIENLIDIDIDNSILKDINDGGNVKVIFKAQPKEVNMYVRINNQRERLVHRGNDGFEYDLQVFDNCVITARMEDVDTLKTIWEDKENVSNLVRVTTNRIVDKTSNSAKVECLLQELYKENYQNSTIKEIGAYYSMVNGNKKVLHVSRTNVIGDAMISDTTLKYNLPLNRLKANTKYKVQTYIVNVLGEEIRGEEIYFRTKAKGGGITKRFYEVANSIPSLIRQSKEANLSLRWGTIEPIRNKYGDIIIDRVSKGKMECVGQIVPINSRVICFKIDSNKDATIQIGQETLNVSKGENYITTNNIYLEGEKYPFKMSLYDDTAGDVDITVSWIEDGVYQEITSSQFYPKEYVKIESAIVDNKDSLKQEIDKNTGRLINKKVLSQNMPVKKLDLRNTKAVLGTDVILKVGIQAEVEGNIIVKEEGAILPIIDNVQLIDYQDKVVVLSDGTELALYKDVDVIGNIKDLRNNKVYDLCKYIQNVTGTNMTLVDGTRLIVGKDVNYIDDNYVRNLYPNNYETAEYQEVMNKYANTERLVYEMTSSNLYDLGVGETRLFEVLPIKILLSFDSDENFIIKDPVIEINGNLTQDKEGKVGNNLRLGFPGDIAKRGYASWRYMNNEKGEYLKEGDISNYATIDKMKNGNFKVTLNGYSKQYGKSSKNVDSNIMLNLLLRVETSDNVTKEDILEQMTQAQNNNYTAYTKIKIKEIILDKKQTKMDVLDAVLPIKIKKIVMEG